MLELLKDASLVAATIAMGLISGLLYGYACSVMPGLAHTEKRVFIAAFQRINVAIINGWFMATFLGAAVLTALAAILHGNNGAVLPWIVSAFILYCLTLGITAFGNIPLNNALDAAGDPAKIADPAAVLARFEAAWNRLHLIRTLTSIAAFACLVLALLQRGRATG